MTDTESSPLAGRTVLVTRAGSQAGPLSEKLTREGARVIEAPLIAFEEPDDWGPADDAITLLGTYDCVIFTSANAVDRFCTRLATRRVGLDTLCTRPLVAIGQATGDHLRARGLPVSSIPSRQQAEGVISLFENGQVRGKRILIPRALVAREILPDGLRDMGARVDVVPVYRTVKVPLAESVREMLRQGEIDLITFTSSSTVESLIDGMGTASDLARIPIAVIGEVTGRTVREHGLTAAVVAGHPSMDALVDAICSYDWSDDREAPVKEP